MPSHMTTVGIPIEDDDSLAHFAVQAIDKGMRQNTAFGTYFRYAMGNGVELWVQVNRNDEIVGVNPHFAGESTIRVGLTERLQTRTISELDGSFYGWLSNDNSVQVPFVFDVPDYLTHLKLMLPAVLPVQLTGFAHELRAYRSAAEYELMHHQDEVQFDTQSFVPTGLFTVDGKANPQPAAFAFFTGTVLRTQPLVNDVTGLTFLWARVSTLGGKIDIVSDPDVCEGTLMRNGVIKGTFWMTGRLQR